MNIRDLQEEQLKSVTPALLIRDAFFSKRSAYLTKEANANSVDTLSVKKL